MRCLKCKKVFNDTFDNCPFCNGEKDESSNDEFRDNIDILEKMEQELSKTIELKTTKSKKRDNREVSLDKTIAINLLNESNVTLLDEINKQIDDINEVKDQEIILEKNIDVEQELASVGSLKKRRKVLVFTGISSLILIAFLLMLFIVVGNIKANYNNSKLDYDKLLQNSLDTYYKTNEIDDLIYLMEDIKSDDKKIHELQEEVKNTCYSWVLKYKKEEANSVEEFENITFFYKELIEGVYRYALIRKDNQYIRALNEVDYDEIMLQFDLVYTDSLAFYDALDLYNKKDYNKAYYMFNKIESGNYYYDKSLGYISKIYENIIELLNKDIIKIEHGIETFGDEEKLNVYILIEEMILEYNNIYNVNLSTCIEYQEILSLYTSKVSQYTDLVYKK